MKWFIPRETIHPRDKLLSPAETLEKLWESPLDEAGFLVLDIETSGFSAQNDLILSLAYCVCYGDTIESVKSALIAHPSYDKVPETIWGLIGLSPSVCQQQGVPITDALHDLLEDSVSKIWVAHHIRHEMAFLQKAVREIWKQRLRPITIDTAVVAQALFRLPQAPLLEQTCQLLGVTVSNRHRADEDVRMTSAVWQKELQLCKRIGLRTVGDLVDWSADGA
ncbi:3'-5' exonuclease [Alicyclobacillus tolerans]|uniref:DNA polymerase-3 subunit epsilon n=1 Tax=Alicyclobacillus tolerans TaxID=90970 RepID=A0A1M6NZS9_9BACL|nr:exonuclease domain-containing protein [Alicyclobacillus montanus]SHK01181.1 DNA polymerase-3 subunit epsilon [Alicyclobacillus montanus]